MPAAGAEGQARRARSRAPFGQRSGQAVSVDKCPGSGDQPDPTEQPDQPITVQDVEDELVRQFERAFAPRPLTDQEHREQVEIDARAVLVFGPECWPPDPPDPDES